MSEIQHGKQCPDCEQETYQWERYCHRCEFDLWEGET